MERVVDWEEQHTTLMDARDMLSVLGQFASGKISIEAAPGLIEQRVTNDIARLNALMRYLAEKQPEDA